MSVIVKGMEMPGSCETCKLGRRYGLVGDVYCNYLHEYFTGNTEPPYKKERPDECPLCELPTPHGRLIGADFAIKHRSEDGNWVYDLTDLDAYLAEIPTIIEAEGET